VDQADTIGRRYISPPEKSDLQVCFVETVTAATGQGDRSRGTRIVKPVADFLSHEMENGDSFFPVRGSRIDNFLEIPTYHWMVKVTEVSRL